ncbi:MAG: hypothetical protein MUF54_01520 [Polyangiaceae bacterium]|jgi:hypothetical protein|nr:hypothetical protein [Polyangiaceae bacterium]
MREDNEQQARIAAALGALMTASPQAAAAVSAEADATDGITDIAFSWRGVEVRAVSRPNLDNRFKKATMHTVFYRGATLWMVWYHNGDVDPESLCRALDAHMARFPQKAVVAEDLAAIAAALDSLPPVMSDAAPAPVMGDRKGWCPSCEQTQLMPSGRGKRSCPACEATYTLAELRERGRA